jgi:hypothetical protein
MSCDGGGAAGAAGGTDSICKFCLNDVHFEAWVPSDNTHCSGKRGMEAGTGPNEH